MSIACWDGKTLAVDSRRITTKRGAQSGDTFSKNISNDSVKLTVLTEQVLFRREEVVCIARTGKLQMTSLMEKALIEGRDLETYFKTAITKNKFKVTGIGTLLIVTKQGAWQFQISKKKGVCVTHVGNQPWAIGCGSKIAMYLMRTLHIEPEHAVSAVILGHSSCGGDIRIWRRASGHNPASVETVPDMSFNSRRLRVILNAMNSVQVHDI